MNRIEVTEMIVTAKIQKGIKWADVAREVGLSKEWVTAGCLGQMTFDKEQAATVGRIFDLSADPVGPIGLPPLHDGDGLEAPGIDHP